MVVPDASGYGYAARNSSVFMVDLEDSLSALASGGRGLRLEAWVGVKATRKILYISPVGERGGAETVLLNILKYHDRHVYEPVVGFLRSGPLVREVEELGVRTVPFPTTRFRDIRGTLKTIRCIRSYLQQEQIRVVFGNMAMGHLYGGLAAIGIETKAVWFLHGISDRFFGVDLAATQVPSSAIFVFTEAARRAKARFSPWGKVLLLPGCVDLSRFDPGSVTKGTLRQELGIGAKEVIVANVARLQRWKGQSLFLHAAGLVHSSNPAVHFVLVGGSLFGLELDYAEQLKQDATRLLPKGKVHFLGHRHDLPQILADVDLLVHCPLTREPFGLDALEAMAMGVPVVGTRTGNTDEVVAPGETGALVPPGDPLAAGSRRTVRSACASRTGSG